ncbi:hypothetical protein SAMN05892883_1983 [Jatrophihabitans sp. GAS493]|uniref:hypothetical protein n=1 Tax=Jatrophihabitans sp. GAS493 TaxID=1907575 RepID=UPI000BB9A5EE|nr:hypothetical protein [Jatrophihabitans sp. GAS493]SOD72610.1 hypothetical protein SAMN05892883_1983 [Jatrophihabitans sp. GAS493]
MALTVDAPPRSLHAPTGDVRLAYVEREARHFADGRRYAISLHGLRIPRRVIYRFVLPSALTLSYSLLMLGLTLFSVQQAAAYHSSNNALRASYDAQMATWFTQVSAGQHSYSGSVVSQVVEADGRDLVDVMLSDGSRVNVLAAASCLPASGASVGSAVSVLRVPSDHSVPAVFRPEARCLQPVPSAAAETSDYALPTYPRLAPINAYLIDEAAAMFGLTLIALGLRRAMLMRRYGIGAAVNQKRRTRRRNFVPYVGTTVLVIAVVAYPVIDAVAPVLRQFLRSHA